MVIQVKLFALARELAARPAVDVSLPDGSTVANLRAALADACPALAALVPQMLMAVNAEFADDRRLLPPAAEVACIPPVSGGCLRTDKPTNP